MLNNYKCDIPYTKTENCIVIGSKDWVKGEGHLLETNNITYMQKVLGVGYTEVFTEYNINVGDVVLLTKASANIAHLRPYSIPNQDGTYANIHQMQVIGVLHEDNNIELFYNKVALSPIEMKHGELISMQDYKVFEIIGVGNHNFDSDWNVKPLEVEVGMTVLVSESNITNITNINGYFAEENCIVGYFDGELKLDNLIPLATNILLKPRPLEKKNGSLYNPSVDLDVEDISEVFNRDRFEVVAVGQEVQTLNKGDIVLVGRDYLSLVEFCGEEYYMASSDEYIKGKYAL